jgi:hypothetical protein
VVYRKRTDRYNRAADWLGIRTVAMGIGVFSTWQLGQQLMQRSWDGLQEDLDFLA